MPSRKCISQGIVRCVYCYAKLSADGAELLSTGARVGMVCFNKTDTVTEGDPHVVDTVTIAEGTAEEVAKTRAIQAEINAGEVGRVEELLIEKPARDDGQMLGRTRRNKVVVFDADRSRVGEYAWSRIERTTGATFVGAETSQPAGSCVS